MQDGTTRRPSRMPALVLAVAGLALSACGGGPQMRDVPYPNLADRAPEASQVTGDALGELVEGEELTWTDSREDVAFSSTVTYARNGRVTGRWENSDTERDGDVAGRWEIQGDRLCVTYAVMADDDSGDGLNCYAVYRQGANLYLVGAEERVFETAQVPGAGNGSG